MASSPGIVRGLLNVEPQYEFTIRWSEDKQFYWTLHNTRGNTEPVAVSETYTTKASAKHSIDQVMALAGTARIDDKTAKP
jgi:uncharacterized protein YegP (UPF0339 family)